jgi:transposase
LSLKKTLRASELAREDIIHSRNEWKEFQSTTESSRLVFLDESGLKTNMTRLYGRAFRGFRCYDHAPCGKWETTSVLSSIRLDGTTESILFEGTVDRKMYEEYFKEILAPQLRPGDIVIMDNLSAHKSDTVVKTAELLHAKVKFLPAYSPDLNPIEQMWSKLKQILRGLKPRTSEELFRDTGTALSMVTADDAQGWFESCGYIQNES